MKSSGGFGLKALCTRTVPKTDVLGTPKTARVTLQGYEVFLEVLGTPDYPSNSFMRVYLRPRLEMGVPPAAGTSMKPGRAKTPRRLAKNRGSRARLLREGLRLQVQDFSQRLPVLLTELPFARQVFIGTVIAHTRLRSPSWSTLRNRRW